MANIIHSISKTAFDWALSNTADTWNKFYSVGAEKYYDGKDWGLIFLLAISLVAVLIYFFVIAQKMKDATDTNYLTIYGLGIVLLLAFNCFVIPNCVTPKFPIKDIWDLNLLYFCLIDILYYTLLFEVWSLLFRGLSKDTNRDLISTIFK